MFLLLSSFILVWSCTEGVTTEFRQKEFLDTVNYLRRSVYPLASNMLKLEWDTNLANSAATYTKTCPTQHSKGKNYYEILYYGGSNNISVLMMYFFMERQKFNYYDTSSCGEPCGHYKILVRSDMTNLGCAITTTPCGTTKNYHVICHLMTSSFKRINDKFLYASGKPCSRCPNGRNYCDSGLCVQQSSAGTCQMICKNCGQLISSNCRCNCKLNFLAVSDCSVSDNGKPSTQCPVCSVAPKSRTLCSNQGTPKASNCSACTCKSGFAGNECQYSDQELKSGVLLVLQWSEVKYRSNDISYYPMNLKQGPAILKVIQPIIIKATKTQCSITIENKDITFAKGFPWIDSRGRMRTQILLKSTMQCKGTKSQASSFLPQATVLKITDSVKSDMSSAVKTCCGVTIFELKIGTSADFNIEQDSRTQSNGGVIVGAVIGSILLAGFVTFGVLVAIAHFFPDKLPSVASHLPWKTKVTATINSNRL